MLRSMRYGVESPPKGSWGPLVILAQAAEVLVSEVPVSIVAPTTEPLERGC